VRDLDAARIAALEKTGLAVAQRLGDTVVGRVPLDRLGPLAELDFVVMIDPG
jgi:hypothetical protein